MRRGFTLIEILVVVTIISIISVVIIQVFFTTTRTNTRTEQLRVVKDNGSFALTTMERIIRNSIAIETSCGVGETTTGTAVIRNPDNNTTTFSCVSDGIAARIASTSGTSTVYLTDQSLTLSNTGEATCTDSTLLFSCPSSYKHDVVVILFSLSILSEKQERLDFATSISPRN